jgi:hypothetical protein
MQERSARAVFGEAPDPLADLVAIESAASALG